MWGQVQRDPGRGTTTNGEPASCSSIQTQTTLFQRTHLVSNTDSKCPYPKTRAMQIARKRSDRTSPSEQAVLQFFQPLFVVPKRDGGLRPILDLRPINRALPFREASVQDVNAK